MNLQLYKFCKYIDIVQNYLGYVLDSSLHCFSYKSVLIYVYL